ncbi:MAG TPA: hypothetical protein ENN46_02510 [Candidatus Woesearchaeota archaeon]|nr:hypothetical protein [Candidatus Woesearchaeota archaeon]
MRRILVFDDYAKENPGLEKELDELSAKLKHLGLDVIHASKTRIKKTESIDISNSVIPTSKGVIIGSLRSMDAGACCIQFLSALRISPILQVPDGMLIKAENIFSLGDELYIGVSEQCTIKAVLFIKKRLIDAKGTFAKINVLKTKKIHLGDVFRVISVGRKKIYFINRNAVEDEFDVISSEKKEKALLSRIKRKDGIYGLSDNESWLLGNRFFIAGSSAFVFDEMRNITCFLRHYGFSTNTVKGKFFLREKKGINDIVKALA